MSDLQYKTITSEGIVIIKDGQDQLIEADSIILCTGQESNNELAGELEAAGISFQIIGGAKLAGELDAQRAIREGIEAALRI
jgi:2,4-dienoyl-CoA reductase (NADPH2)